ncbi:MAG: amino-acid N-acetyltransferase [Verrucomicrobiae bacterium]|nr:amino-acid N-acetyltransferase [Verrucomicrobiae bacterium]MCX7721823.1 amino-acid N-acetyltransferase [Verrucomicrobiae bacterium]MDW7980946.1 amino-acid N-acetyltransferase [Verrucomicrobiales bacterium]
MKLTDLRAILQYVPRFRDRTFVLALDGAVVADDNFPNILLDVAVLRSLNIRVVLVHGAAEQIKALAEQRGIVPSNLDGSGVTDEQTLSLAVTAANQVTHKILEGLSVTDLRAASANAVIAHPLGIIHGVDHKYTGKVERIDTEFLQTLLGNGIIPVIPPLGFNGEGRTYRVNSDNVALAVARALGAVKLIFITTADGLIYQGRVIRQILVGELEALLEKNRAGFVPEQLAKAECAAAACRAGVERVHVINGREDEGLLAEVFSNEGIGTLVYADEYDQIRRARKKDVTAILALTRTAVEADELLKRTRADIERHLEDYFIFEIDNNPVGCVALHMYPEYGKAELACLYVKPSHENRGIGRKLVQFVEKKAREAGMRELFALSTQAYTYFQSKAGFVEGTPDDLPPPRREKYEQSGRRSKVLIKKLV